MYRRAALAVLLALTVVVAGCQFGGNETDVRGLPPGATQTGTPDTGTPSPTATPTPDPFGDAAPPPGVDASGVSDVDALMTAHAETLNGSTATVDVRFRLTVNGTGQNVSLRGKVLPGTDRGWMHVAFSDGVGDYYTADGTTYYREVVGGEVDYGTTTGVSAIPDRPRFGSDQRIRTAVSSANWTFVETVERDGRTLFRFEASSVDPPDVNKTGNTTISSDGTLVVDSRGVVHHVSVNTTVETDRGTVHYGLAVAITDVGSTTLQEPDWVDLARGSI